MEEVLSKWTERLQKSSEANLEVLLPADHLRVVAGVHVLAEVLVEVLEAVVEEHITLDRTRTQNTGGAQQSGSQHLQRG